MKRDFGTKGTPARAWKDRYLQRLRETGAVRYACESAGVGRSTAYRERQRDEQFARAWAEALEDSVDELEVEARRRARDGSDQLLMFLLKAHRPGVYRDTQKIEHAVATTGPPMVDVQSQDLEEIIGILVTAGAVQLPAGAAGAEVVALHTAGPDAAPDGVPASG